MPELPEVESLRRSLVKYVVGQKVKSVSVKLSKIVSARGTKRIADERKKNEFEMELVGKKISSLSRRAKNIMINFDDGGLVLVHLKMTGQLVFQNKENTVWGGHPIEATEITKLPNKHTYVSFELENGNLFYNDVRQFGYLLYYKNQIEFEKEKHFESLGFEPLNEDFTLENFTKKLKTKTGILKKVFLDQTVVVGLGNIYCDEVCFAAGVFPFRKVSSLKSFEIKKLYQETIRIIPLAIAAGGSSIANYLLGDGSRGNYAHSHKVYNRAGKACLVCGQILEKNQTAGRTTVFCLNCQK